jgi:hypothetical protein
MKLVQELMEHAASDIDVLRSLESNGDVFTTFREVDFLLIAPTQEQAEVISDFLNDHHYGKATCSEVDGKFHVQVFIHMPVTQAVIACVSGFMACVARMFGANYDGWGCVAQRQA